MNKYNISIYKIYSYITILVIICCAFTGYGQIENAQDSVLSVVEMDSIPSITNPKLDSVDTIGVDSASGDNLGVKISNDSFDSEINYFGRDSTIFEKDSNRVHLYGNAYVHYTTLKVEASYIMFDFNTNIVTAYGLKDSAGIVSQKPTFTEGSNTFTYNKLRYNFKTRKGFVYDAVTKEGEFHVHGSKTKFISKESDSTYVDDQIFQESALITTCDAEHPHYGIRARKLKLIPNKLAIIGPSQLEIAGIPTPFFLPFGFFPLIKGQSSGLIFPSNFDFDKDYGLGFKEIGYYFPINDYIDLKLTGDIYTRGSFVVRANSQYRKRYAYNGSLDLSYSSYRIDNATTGGTDNSVSFSINLRHVQDTKAHPYRKIDGSINISTNKFDQRNNNSAQSQFTNTFRSNFGYSHSLPGTPFDFSAALSHDQNTRTRVVNLTLPDIRLNMRTINPFERKDAIGEKKWFEKITLKYNANIKNYVRSTDTTLFTQQTLEDLQYGVSQKASSDVSFRMLKYFNISPNANYEEYWYFRTLDKEFDPTLLIDSTDTGTLDGDGNKIYNVDTTYGVVNDILDRGFKPFRKFNMGISLNTSIFGTKTFSKGLIRGIRHTIKPSLSFNYSPDTKDRYTEILPMDDTRSEFSDEIEYNPFSGGIFNNSLRDKQMTLSFGFRNEFEVKYYSKKDSTEKKFKIIDNLNINGGYNFARDSLQWQPLTMTASGRYLKGIIGFNTNASFSHYVRDESGTEINQTIWSARKRPVEFRNWTTNITTRLKLEQIMDFLIRKSDVDAKELSSESREDDTENLPRNGEPGSHKKGGKGDFDQSFFDVFGQFSLDHSYRFTVSKMLDGRDTFMTSTHSISLRGNIPLTKNWNIGLGNIAYDIKNKSLVYPTLSVSRDLHCWRMSFNWYPSNGVYGFFVGVKSNTLSFLKLNYGQNNSSIPFR